MGTWAGGYVGRNRHRLAHYTEGRIGMDLSDHEPGVTTENTAQREEAALTARLIVAANHATTEMPQGEIDQILGVPGKP